MRHAALKEDRVRQMLRWVKIVDVGDTDFLADQQVEKWMFEEENERIMGLGRTARRR